MTYSYANLRYSGSTLAEDRWDERFFQLSKDTLSFVRNVITAGVFVAILVPAVKDLLPAILEFFK